jgi:hypothetical protein
MARQPGLLGGLLGGDSRDRDIDADAGFGTAGPIDGRPLVRLGEPDEQRFDAGFATPPGFDPVWGTLGAQPQGDDDWLGGGEDDADGVAVDVEVLGDGFHIAGQIRTGQFDRLSDWLNMQSGFIQIRDAAQVHLGKKSAAHADRGHGMLWVRLHQVALVAERSTVQRDRAGAPAVAKQRRKVSIITPGHNLRGSIHVHAGGSMTHFLESPDPHFLPMTDLTVRWLSDAAMIARFPFALVNREQIVTVLDESTSPAEEVAETSGRHRKTALG